MLDNLGDVRHSFQVHPLVFFITQKSSLEWQLKAEAQEKKKSRSKDGFAPEEVVLPPAREQTMPEEVI